MASDVLITPASGLIQFSSSAGSGSGQIKVDGDDLVISNVLGDVLLGDGASDVFIGNGTDNVDIVFEQNGEIRDDASGKSITLGSKTTNILISGSNTIAMQKGGGNVGIGKTAATTTLEVEGDISGSGTGSFSGGRFTGNVGIGTTSPDNPLHISYNSSAAEGSVQNNTGQVGLQIENTNASGVAAIHLRSSDSDGYIMYDDNGSNNGDFYFKTDGQDGASVLTLKDDGKVGIGTESPLEKLHVGGNITSSGNITAVSMSGDGSSLTGVSATLPGGVVSSSAQIADVTLTTAAQTNITSLGTLTTLTVDDITINGSTISDGGDFTLDVEGDITLDANGADIILSDDGTDFGRFKRDSSDFIIKSETNNKDIVFRGQDGGATITALTLDMSEAGKAIFTGDISSSGNIIGELTGIGGAVTGITSLLATDIKIGEDDETKIDFETANEIHFYANNVEQVYLADNIFGPQSDSDVDLGASGVRWKDSYFDTVTTRNLTTTGATTIGDGNDVIQFNPRILVEGDISASGDLHLTDITASGTIIAEHLSSTDDAEITDDLTVGGDITVGQAIFHDGDTDTKIVFTGDVITFTAGNEQLLQLSEGGQDKLIVGDGGDVDFQVKTNGDANTIFAQGSSDNVGIGTSTPGEKLDVIGNISASGELDVKHRFFDTGSVQLGSNGGGLGDIIKIGDSSTVPGAIYQLQGGGTWALTDADAAASATGSIAVALGANSTTNGMLLRGIAKLNHDPGGLAGAPVYLAVAAGSSSNAVPSGNNDIARIVGHNIDTSGMIYFNPDNTFVEVSA